MATRHGLANDQPHSFVLADLFDVVSLEQCVPDDVCESDPSLEWVTCPTCDGEKWLEKEGNGWVSALFTDVRRAYAHRHLNHSYKICGRCKGYGEVLDCPALTAKEQTSFIPCQSVPVTVLTA
jgi:hypothetical protein